MTHKIDLLITKIDSKMVEILKTNRLFSELKRRPPTPKELSQYLINCHYLITYTQPNLRSALIASVKAYNRELSDYFLDKIFEEIGHEKWAEDDVLQNNLQSHSNMNSPTASLKKLTEYLTKISTDYPLQYSAYVLVAEYSMAHYGQRVLELFRATSNENNKMTVVSKHVELDAEHSDCDEKKLIEILNKTTLEQFQLLIETVSYSLDLLDKSIAESFDESNTITTKQSNIKSIASI
ncbi:MAG: hypothetical protein KA715_08625 [Xanthomonadaceae bacterium]|nr:hypothetical protein [Xanthomonadaceae bacterium]